ncbi:potassium-transporting ATPase subunit A [Bacillus clarus]|uniref:Potassium-transporting ATPase potassium-binding subunit n=1 Tax=Bacillus clarus TaxID=2338372 RepID=A0A090ZIP4_9BACI|nr:potassium-transporting ATPase subunit KdpA [Bacillus clarus]KFN04066.1 K+-transporting ATPase, A subunit [Bacillus clarus]RFT68555.1 potassium-transporting ATPase subunit A [Bacillus clarus]
MNWLTSLITIGLFVLIAKLMGDYIYNAFQKRDSFQRVYGPLEGVIFKVAGIKGHNQTGKQYMFCLIMTNFFFIVVVYSIFRLQGMLPLNPNHFEGLEPTLAFHTAITFMTNANLQHYGGESSLSYFSQMVGVTFMMFAAPATSMAVGITFIRLLAGKRVGNFFVDFVQSITRVLLPIAFVMSLLFVLLGTPQTLDSAVTVKTAEGTIQEIPRGPVASLLSIKELGDNGGGFFGTVSAHPFENPNMISNVLQMMLQMLIPMAFPFVYGRMVGNRKQGRIFFISMLILFVIGFGILAMSEVKGNPLLNQFGLESSQGNMEGKEARLGVISSALYATVTSASGTGGVNTTHDTLTPIGVLVPLVNMLLGTVFGGIGVGFMNVIMYAMIAVFLAGLMVGRTPEFLNKKLEGKEMKLIAITIVSQPLLILGAAAIAFSTHYGTDAISNPGFHGLTQVIYEYTSSAVNNGSGFEGLKDNTPFWNLSTGIVMYIGRYLGFITMLAVAVGLKKKKVIPETVGTFQTDTHLFGGILLSTVCIVGALTFLPVLVLGPIAEFLTIV